MKIPNLFYRNDRGRYVRFDVDNDVSSTLYRRIDGKYVPVGSDFNGMELQEGIWVVTGVPSFRSITNGHYLRESFCLDKISDIKRVPMDRIADMKVCADYVLEQAPRDITTRTIQDIIYFAVSKVYEYNEQLEEVQRNEKK